MIDAWTSEDEKIEEFNEIVETIALEAEDSYSDNEELGRFLGIYWASTLAAKEADERDKRFFWAGVSPEDIGDAQAAREALEAHEAGETIPWEEAKIDL